MATEARWWWQVTNGCWKWVPGCGTRRREAAWSVSWQSIARDSQVMAWARPYTRATRCCWHRDAHVCEVGRCTATKALAKQRIQLEQDTTGWLKIKYPSRQYAISLQPVARFLRATAVPAGTAEARISNGNSVCPSVCLSRPGGIPSPGEIETPGLHHKIAYSL